MSEFLAEDVVDGQRVITTKSISGDVQGYNSTTAEVSVEVSTGVFQKCIAVKDLGGGGGGSSLTAGTGIKIESDVISTDIGSGEDAPTTETVGFVGKLYVRDNGDVYVCTGVSGSTYTWTKVNGGSSSMPKANFTINGNPTVAVNLLGGISTSNYITLDYTLDATKDFEVGVKAKLNSNSSNYLPIIACKSSENRMFIGKDANGNPHFNLGDGTGTWGTGASDSNVSITTGQYYYFKAVKSGSTLTIYTSTDKQNWSSASATNSYGSSFVPDVGTEYNSSNVWLGNVDLSEIYIKDENGDIVYEAIS